MTDKWQDGLNAFLKATANNEQFVMMHYSITSTCHELYEMIDKVTRIVPWINMLESDTLV